MKRTTWLVALAVAVTGCFGDADTEEATTASSTHNVATTTTTSTTTTSTTTMPPTTLSSTTMPATTRPPTTTSRTIGDAVALAQARLDELSSVDPANPYGALEVSCPNADRPIAIGDLFMCQGLDRSSATNDIHSLAFLVLDNDGTTSMLTRGDLADLEAAYGEAPHGLLCRDLVAGEAPGPFDLSFVTYDTPDFDTAAFLAAAYWFLEGRPDRMDADGNGIPCETVFPAESIAWVWDGGLLTGGYPERGESIPNLLHRIDDLPAVPVGSRLVNLSAFSGGVGILIETPNGWQVWSGPGGDASWRIEKLPDEVFEGAVLSAVALRADATYVAGQYDAGDIPAVWRRNYDGTWIEIQIEHHPGLWGNVGRIVECDDNVVFTGHYSASNAVIDYRIWGFGENGDIEEVFGSSSGPPGSGTPPPAVSCHDGSFMALVTFGREPEPGGDFTHYNEIWSSPTGSDWSLVAADTIDPAVRPRDDLGVVWAGSAFWIVSDEDIATSSDGVRWNLIDRETAGLEPDDWIDAMGGGGLGLLLAGIDHAGDPIDAVMWWTPDGRTWERIDDHPALDPGGVEIVGYPTGLMIALRRSFQEGAPVMWVYSAAG